MNNTREKEALLWLTESEISILKDELTGVREGEPDKAKRDSLIKKIELAHKAMKGEEE